MNGKSILDQVTEIKEAGKCVCELCIRYCVVTEAATERPLDHEYISGRKDDMPVCDACADMIDNA
jgi:hypothetical protein